MELLAEVAVFFGLAAGRRPQNLEKVGGLKILDMTGIKDGISRYHTLKSALSMYMYIYLYTIASVVTGFCKNTNCSSCRLVSGSAMT